MPSAPPPAPATPRPRPFQVLGALLIVYFLWGGTYLGIRVAVRTIPPFLMAGTRFLTAGTLVYLYTMAKGAARPRWEHWRDAGVVGALLLLGGNGIVSWAEQLVPSGVAALLVATVPLWMIVLGLLGPDARRPHPVILAALGLGLAGIAVLALPSGAGSGKLSLVGVGALLIAAFLWSLGSIFSRRARLPGSPLMAVGMQMIVGGALLLLTAGLTGEWSRLEFARISLASAVGMAYLVVFGSIVAFNAYIWLLKNADPTWVSTYAFVNPIVAVFLGWLILQEPFTTRSLVATVIIVLAVVLITVQKNRETAAARLTQQ